MMAASPRFAVLSVSDKRGVVDFARTLAELGFGLLSTGGTAAALREAGLPVTDIAEHTGSPEMLDGRVKTLHPRVHGGILARRDLPEHMATLAQQGIAPIDIVAVNLYPFAQTVAQPGCSMDDAIENIDIGGPAMVRAAAKNHGGAAGGVGIITDPDDYAAVLDELHRAGGLTAATRYRLAVKAFTHTARYDGMVANWLSSRAPGAPEGGDKGEAEAEVFPKHLQLGFDRLQTLRYGENPHQSAAFYRDPLAVPGGVASARQLQGKELSYNNIADADAAWECVKAFGGGACVIVKHANPCGVALGDTPLQAYRRAFATDPTSAFGGIIAFNREVDAATAEAVSKQFMEVLVAPAYSADALALLAAKANVRVLQCALPGAASDSGAAAWDFKRVGGGLLAQTRDVRTAADADLRVVSRRQPTPIEMADLRFAWTVARFVKSNAIVYCKDGQTVGVGAGQMSRVDSTRIARIKAENAGLTVAGSVVASDAFFPFRDGLDVLAEAGATAVIQPGGSQRDAEVIAAADEHGIAMVLTSFRHFRH